jgi:hypothetical protein
MIDPKDIHKLRVMLPHWMQHNMEHREEFREWGRRVEEVAVYLEAAAHHFEEATFMLREALEHLGGAVQDEHYNHGHPAGEYHHHHPHPAGDGDEDR